MAVEHPDSYKSTKNKTSAKKVGRALKSKSDAGLVTITDSNGNEIKYHQPSQHTGGGSPFKKAISRRKNPDLTAEEKLARKRALKEARRRRGVVPDPIWGMEKNTDQQAPKNLNTGIEVQVKLDCVPAKRNKERSIIHDMGLILAEFLTKAIITESKYRKIFENKYNDIDLEGAKEQQKKFIAEQFNNLIVTASDSVFGTAEQKFQFFESMIDEARAKEAESAPSVKFPTKAPKLYKERDKSLGQTPEQFTEDEYGDYIGQKGFTRALIGELDPGLYRAYYNHGISDEFKARVPAGRRGEKPKVSDAEAGRRKRQYDREYSHAKTLLKNQKINSQTRY